MNRALVLIMIAGCLVSCSLISETGRTEESVQAVVTRVSDGEVVLTADLDPGRKLLVVTRSEPYVERQHGRIRIDGTVPERVFSGIDVFISGRKVEIPPCAFARFGDPHLDAIKIGKSGEHFFLELAGGDGGGSQTSRLAFTKDRFVSVQGRNPFTWKFDPLDEGIR